MTDLIATVASPRPPASPRQQHRLATLIEANVDAHTIPLATALGVKLPEGRLTPEEGNGINDILNKRA